ncbi:hypothetical protein Gotur_033240 [Gossypium turneri]
MTIGAKTKEMGWDLSIRAQSRRAQMMTSVWLGNCEFLDLVLGINLVGREYHTGNRNRNESGNLENSSMEHDLEDYVIVGEEEGFRGGLCLTWRAGINVQLQSFSKRHIDVIINDAEEGYNWRFTGRMEAFRKVLEECSLSDMGFNGNWFTWERGNLPETNIQERLDRGVANEEWLQIFPEFQIQHLPHTFSNHCPLLVHTKKECRERVHKEFKFEAWWVLEDSFLDEVKNIWEHSEGEFLSVGDHISVWNDCWVSGVTEDRLQNNSRSESIRVVVDLINEESKTWNRDLIVNTFNTDIARKILRISLSKTAQEDIQGQMNSAWDFVAGYGESGQAEIKLEGVKERVLTLTTNTRPRQRIQRANKTIFLDAAFDSQHHRSASGLIVKNEVGRIVGAKSILHDNVASPFAAEAYARFQVTRFYFNLRSENIEAHRLAKRTLQKGEEQYLEGETLRSIGEDSEPSCLRDPE